VLPAHCTTLPGYREARSAFDTPSIRPAVASAVPAGAAVAGSQGAFLRAVDEHPDAVVLRVDGREHVRSVAWVVASMASWADLTARPTWPVLMERTGLSRASVARWLAWLRRRGLLGVVESGTTPRFAPMALAQDAGNRAAVYVLCAPEALVATAPEDVTEDELRSSVEESETPTFLFLSSKKDPYPGARENLTTDGTTDPLRGREKRSDEPRRREWARTAVAHCRADRLALVERLRASAPALRPLSAPALCSLLRPWVERPELGWTVAWLLHAIDTTPAGEARTWTSDVRAPAGWLRFRLSAWLDEHGQPLPSPGVQQAAARSAQRAAAAQDQAERAAQARQGAAELEFGQLVREIAGDRYPALVAVVLTTNPGGRLMPATAAEALTRHAIRVQLAVGRSRPDTVGTNETADRAVATAIRAILAGR
jgi:hypothetical protein